MAERGASGASANGRAARPSAPEVARRASQQLRELVGRDPEGVVSLERTDDGWRVGVEVVESHRIPETADILAEYEVEVDGRGRLVGYRRARRYQRGRTQDDR
jgi:hypothetical protein